MKFYRYTFFKPPFDATKLSCIDIVSLVFFFFGISLRGILCGGGQGEREKRGEEMYGRREKRGREAGFPRWREAGEKGENYPTLRNTSQSKKMRRGGSQQIQGGNRD